MQVLGVVLLAPMAVAMYDVRHLEFSEMIAAPDVLGFGVAILLAIVVGTVVVVYSRDGKYLQGVKEGYAIVALGWLSLSFVGAIPLWIWMMAQTGAPGLEATITDAYFEIMSGFSTTGATIFSDVESLPRSLLLLRSLTHWLGGMGIITLAIVIFPAMGVSGYQMFRGEVPGPTKDRLQPRLAQTAQILWGVYLLFTAVETVLLYAGGMTIFDAVCHTFATMATGGFSTRNASIAAYQSDFIEWVVIIFMYLAGVNFVLHFHALRGRTKLMTQNSEFRFYNGIIILSIVTISAVLYFQGPAPADAASKSYRYDQPSTVEFAEHYQDEQTRLDGLYNCFRVASFQTLAIVTTTGFATADFDLWPDFLRILLVLLMFCGGCAGSTGGGIKMIRIMVVAKVGLRELRKLSQPRLVAPVKVGGRALDDQRIINIVSFSILFIGLFVIISAAMMLFVPDMLTAISCSIATLGNIGPGLAGVGAVENYGWIPLPGKWILIFSMLLGRLEIFTVLIVLRPAVWRK